jgi:hypothetical protein
LERHPQAEPASERGRAPAAYPRERAEAARRREAKGPGMIRVHVHQDDLDAEGGWVLYITGHANTQVCAGVSGIWHTMLLGFQWLAKRYPKQVKYHQSTTSKKKPVH